MIPFQKSKLSSLIVLSILGESCLALGIGNPEVKSNLGAPLEAVIPLLAAGDVSAQHLVVKLADISTQRQFGIEPTWLNSNLTLTHSIHGNRRSIRVSSKAPAMEPYINFVLNLRWPEGNIVREVTLLLDPPAANTAASTHLLKQPKAAAEQTDTHSDSPPTHFNSNLVTQPGDSLWRLAGSISRPQGTTITQAMNALYHTNPRAFINGDPAKLRVLEPLKRPTAEQIASASRTLSASSHAPTSTDAVAPTSAELSPRKSGVDTHSLAGTALPSGNSKLEPRHDNLQDQMQGLIAGIGAIEAGKVRAKEHVGELEDTLSQLVSRYESMSQRAKTIEQELQARTQAMAETMAVNHSATPQTRGTEASGSANNPASAWLMIAAVIGGCAALGHKAGVSLTHRRKTRKAPPPASSCAAATAAPHGLLKKAAAHLRKENPRGSTTYEQPHLGTHNTDRAARLTDTTGQLSLRDLKEAVVRYPERLDLKLELLETYAVEGDRPRFENLARNLSNRSRDSGLRQHIDKLRRQHGYHSNPQQPDLRYARP